ncbi:hypothetical protein Leryth_003476 [Lithospermum erythrorhizon]|nr:hypothetical protein Leryth_003476 [Lithospermum erythrorhizon]
MAVPMRVAERTRFVWRMRLHSAFRTTFACTILGCTILYGPSPLTSLVKFPSFAYLTAVLIVSDARLGDTIRGLWHALLATAFVLPLSMACLWLIQTTNKEFSTVTASLAVAVNTFLVAFPDSTHLMAKRIAFGQIVVVYVDVVNYGVQTSALMHPLHVALSTGLGAVASVLALFLPFPRPAYKEVKKLSQLYIDNAAERINLYMNAFNDQNRNSNVTTELLSSARISAETGEKLLQGIKDLQEGMAWEMYIMRFFRPNFVNPGDRLKCMETPMRGMELALTSPLLCEGRSIDGSHCDNLKHMAAQLQLKLEQARCFAPSNSVTTSEVENDLKKTLAPTTNTIPKPGDLPALFFRSCAELFLNDSMIKRIAPDIDTQLPKAKSPSTGEDHEEGMIKRFADYLTLKLRDRRLLFSTRCSLSLSASVFLGLIFDKENGYWSGLAIAISFESGKQAIFTMANARGQGTAIGTAYGVLICFVFQRLSRIMFIALLPWIFLTSILRHSRMYGTTGGFVAAIGALLIIGRRNYGPPNEFAIARLVEVFIGLSCFITVELLLQPTRAATLAKNSMNLSLRGLGECLKFLVLHPRQEEELGLNFPVTMKERRELLKTHVNDVNRHILDAELEPDFWFSPFPGHCYRNLYCSLSNMEELVHIMDCNIELLSRELLKNGVDWSEIQEQLKNTMEHFNVTFNNGFSCLEETTPSSSMIHIDMQEQPISFDLEKGETSTSSTFSILTMKEDAAEKVLNAFLHTSQDIITKFEGSKGEEFQGKVVTLLSTLGFSIYSLTIEIQDIERNVRVFIH